MIGDPVHPHALRPPRVTVVPVDYDDPAAGALRDAMAREMNQRYADRIGVLAEHADTMSVHPGTIVYTALAVTADGLPVGHLTLRRAAEDLDEDLELKRMYVVPPYRGAGVAGALLRAAEEAARRLRARRIILQTGDRQPDAERLYAREGYRRIPVFAPYDALSFSRCYAKPLA